MLKKILHSRKFVLMVLLNLFTCLASVGATQITDEEGAIEDIKKYIKTVNEKVKGDLKELEKLDVKEVVITLGMTGEGKSTLLNFLAGKSFQAIKTAGQWKLEILTGENYLDGITPGHTVNSTTSEPAYWYDTDNKRVYYDCPGFADTRVGENASAEIKEIINATHNIKNAYSIEKLFNAFQENVKILLVAAESSIQNKGVAFLDNNVRILEEFFKKDIPKFGNLVCLIVTRQQNFDTILDVEESLREFKNYKLPEYLKQIAFFPMADKRNKSGDPFLDLREEKESDSLQEKEAKKRGKEVKEHILSALNSTPVAQKISPILAVPDKTQNFAVKVANKVSEDTRNFIKTKVVEGIYKHCNNQIETGTNPHTLRGYFKTLKEDLDSIDTLALEGFKKNTQDFFKKCGIEHLYKKDDKDFKDKDEKNLEDQIGYITFLKGINSNINDTNFFTSWKDDLWSSVKDKLMELEKDPLKDPANLVQNDTLQIKGIFLGISDIRKALEQNAVKNALESQSNYKIELYCLNTLYLDEDITSPGNTVSFIAPCWKVIPKDKSISINLSGLPGKTGEKGGLPTDGIGFIGEGQAPTVGKDGEPGGPGKNGGIFFGKGFTFSNIESLKVIANGGKGGNGGEGGRGGNGRNARDGQNSPSGKSSDSGQIALLPYAGTGPLGIGIHTNVPTRDGELQTRRVTIVGGPATNLKNWIGGDWHHQITIVGSIVEYMDAPQGEIGKDGGKGGAKGLGGKHGEIVLLSEDLKNSEKKEGGEGDEQGAGGKGGEGGKNGYVSKRTRWENCYLTGNGTYKLSDIWIEESARLERPTTEKADKGKKPTLISDKKPDEPNSQITEAELTAYKEKQLENYSTFYFQQAELPVVSPFIKKFPGLPKPNKAS